MRLHKRLRAFNEKRGSLLDEMDALDSATLVAKHLDGKWSILDIIERLVLAERALLKGLPEPSQLRERERRLKHRFSYLIVMFVLRYGIPVQVSSPAMAPRGDHSLGELRHLWDENQKWLEAYIDRLDRKGFRGASAAADWSPCVGFRQDLRTIPVEASGAVLATPLIRTVIPVGGKGD